MRRDLLLMRQLCFVPVTTAKTFLMASMESEVKFQQIPDLPDYGKQWS